MVTTSIAPLGPFDLVTSSSFLCGFTPAAGTSGVDADGKLVLGFLADGGFEPTVAAARVEGGVVRIDAESEAVASQLGRVLSLDHDATPLAALGARDPVIAAQLRRRPGFRPVVFPSPYEAAVWGVLAQRTSMAVAASVRRKMSEATGAVVTGFGRTFFPAPAPKKLLAVKSFPGVSEEKLLRMHGVARAALEGKLDPQVLRALPEERALDQLERLRGVGAWTARHVLYRGCGVADAVPTVEPRFLGAVGSAFGLGRPATAAEAGRLAEAWRPLRMWVAILLVWNLGNFSGSRASKGNALPRREGSPPGAHRGSRQEPVVD